MSNTQIYTNKILGNWKNFVVDFRRSFDSKVGCAGGAQSLSLLIAALAARLTKSDVSKRACKNPREKETQAAIAQSMKTSAIIHEKTKRAVNCRFPYELQNCAEDFEEDFEEDFATILDAVDRCAIARVPFALGYTYQYWRHHDRRGAVEDIQSADKEINRDRLIAFTQIYTPEWVVDFLLANTLLPQVPEALRKHSRLKEWQLPSEQKQLRLEEITVIDPAAGAGNFLLGAFDTLLELHIANKLPKEMAVQKIFEQQLHGCDIDALALSVTATALVLRALAVDVDTTPNLNGLALAIPDSDHILGSLSDKFDDHHPLSKKHHVVVTNPPYIGRKLMSRELKTLMKSTYPTTHHDLSAAFFERSLNLLRPGGRTGLITQASMMFLPSHSKLREKLLSDYQLISAIDAGPRVFPLQGGEKVNSAILVAENSKPALGAPKTSLFFDLKDEEDKEQTLKELIRAKAATRVGIETLRQFRGCAFNYYIPRAVIDIIASTKSLDTVCDIKQGLATTDNERFVKFVWEVPESQLGTVWRPYVKGAGGQRFHSPVRHVVKWADDGAEIKESVALRYPYLKGKTEWVVKNESYYFQEGLCFSFVNTRGVAVRHLPAGCIFDVGASAIFSKNSSYLLALLNSSFMVALASSLNPTINYQVGDLKRLPFIQPPPHTERRLAAIADECVSLKEELSILTDPSSWFRLQYEANSNALSNLDVLIEFANAAQKDFAGAHESFVQCAEGKIAAISDREREIDSMVFETIWQQNSWDQETANEVKHWIEKFNKRAPLNSPPLTAQLLLDILIAHQLLNVHSRLDSWQPLVKQVCGMEIEDYLRTEFALRMNRVFSGRPPSRLLA